jgi:phosphatidylglycerophosphate synthase
MTKEKGKRGPFFVISFSWVRLIERERESVKKSENDNIPSFSLFFLIFLFFFFVLSLRVGEREKGCLFSLSLFLLFSLL